MSTVGDTMSTLGVFSTLGDIMSTPGEYHDKCGGRSLGKQLNLYCTDIMQGEISS